MTEKAYLPVCTDGDSDVDCTIEYEVTGFYSLHLTSCKVYDDGPDILPMIDEAEQGRIEQVIGRRIEWKKEPRYHGDN